MTNIISESEKELHEEALQIANMIYHTHSDVYTKRDVFEAVLADLRENNKNK